MSKFVVIVLPSKERIPEAIRALRNMHGNEGIKLYASTVVVRDPGGKLSVQEIPKEGHSGAAVGALIGAFPRRSVGVAEIFDHERRIIGVSEQ